MTSTFAWRWLGLEGNPPTKDIFPPYKPAINLCLFEAYGVD